jgi:hypothetical protein
MADMLEKGTVTIFSIDYNGFSNEIVLGYIP